MAAVFPRFVLLNFFNEKGGVFASHEGDYLGFPNRIVLDSKEGVFNPLAKIEVEPAKINSTHFHLRFCHVNRYCGVSKIDDGIGYVVAESKAPEEFTSKLSCTLFERTHPDDIDGSFYLIHAHTGWHTRMSVEFSCLFVANQENVLDVFRFVDWETVVKLPKHVAFKGDNGKYLQAHLPKGDNGLPYLQFSSDDAYDISSGFRVERRPDGYVWIKSDHFGKFWRLSHSWISTDEERDSQPDRYEDAFWPVRIDNNTIALRNGKNNNYCVPLSDSDQNYWLNAAVFTITKEARLVVEELVQERKIYAVKYRMEDARIFNEKPYLAGTTTVCNKTGAEVAEEVEVSLEMEESYTFSKGVSLTAGVKTTIEAGVPFIIEGKVELSFEISGKFEWSHTESTKKAVKARGKIPVPAESEATVHYVGTKGSCHVPFSYTQQEQSSVDGRITYSVEKDGLYTGANCYNFRFVIDKIRPITE